MCARRPSHASLTVHNHTANRSLIKADREELYHLVFKLASSTQKTNYPKQPHTHFPHCLEQTQTHHPTKWKQLLPKLFHLLQYFAKLSDAHAPLLNKPVRFYHTLFPSFLFYNFHILSSYVLDFILYILLLLLCASDSQRHCAV